MSLILFGTEGCHLCEDAEALLHRVLPADLTFSKQDIIGHAEWEDRYAILIPVLLDTESGQELRWPFDAEKIQHFINGLNQ
jgi:hypothetical protein